MRLWLYRLLGIIPREEPRYDFTIVDGKRIDFEKPLTPWQAVERINRER